MVPLRAAIFSAVKRTGEDPNERTTLDKVFLLVPLFPHRALHHEMHTLFYHGGPCLVKSFFLFCCLFAGG
jgi:hypothetical protein